MKIVWGSARACPVASPKAPRVRNPSGTFRRRLKVTLLSCGKTACPCQRTSWKRCCWQYEQIATGLRTASGGCAGVPAHRELDRGTLRAILRQTDIGVEGLHSFALSGQANACAFLAVLSPPPLLPTHRPASLV